MPFPIYPSRADILQSLNLNLNYLIVSENTSFTLFASQLSRQIIFHQYNNSDYSEWRFESFEHESVVYYRIKNSITGMYLVIDPLSGAGVGYRLTLTMEKSVVHSQRASWQIVRNRNGSFSFINAFESLSITYSYEVKTRLVLRPFANLPTQHYYFYDFLKGRGLLIGQSA